MKNLYHKLKIKSVAKGLHTDLVTPVEIKKQDNKGKFSVKII